MEGRSREDELKKEGWTRQSVLSEPRLSEVVELYESMGLEVRVEPVDLEELDEECKACFEADPESCKVVYTRPKREDS